MHRVHTRIVSVLIATVAATSLLSAPPAKAAILYNNGGLITNPGAAFMGADASQPSADVAALGTTSTSSGSIIRKVADDFTVPAGGWSITSATGFVYMQATYPTFPPTSPITGVTAQIWNATPSGVNTGLIATSTTILDTSWTGIYRTANGDNTINTRPIMAVTADFGTLNLSQGTYWVSFTYTGLAPGNVTAGITPFVMNVDGSGLPVTVTGNGILGQSVNGGSSYSWNAQQLPHTVAYPFIINGSVPAPGAAALLGLGGLVAARRRRAA